MESMVRGLDGQFSAALSMLDYCIRSCPASEWQASHGDYPFSQVVFHALFFTDLYLDQNFEHFKAQAFHREKSGIFKDYEELEDRLPVNLYPQDFCGDYLRHCLNKAHEVLARNSEKDFSAVSALSRSGLSTFELYIDAIRHIQHHAAQLGLRLQLLSGKEMPWAGSGWKDLV